MFVWGYLGLMWALICLGFLNGDARPKSIVPTPSMLKVFSHFLFILSYLYLIKTKPNVDMLVIGVFVLDHSCDCDYD